MEAPCLQDSCREDRKHGRQHERGFERALIVEAWDIAHETMDYLRYNARVSRMDCGGFLRRMKEMIGDIDLLAVWGCPEDFMDAFSGMPLMSGVLLKGKPKTSAVLKGGLQVDLRVAGKSCDAALQYFTGNQEHNIALRKIADSKGYRLSEYGLDKKVDGKMIPARGDEGIYNRPCMDWIPPGMTENRGKMEFASEGRLTRLRKNSQRHG